MSKLGTVEHSQVGLTVVLHCHHSGMRVSLYDRYGGILAIAPHIVYKSFFLTWLTVTMTCILFSHIDLGQKLAFSEVEDFDGFPTA